MKPIQPEIIIRSNYEPVAAVALTLDEQAVVHLMSVLTDLYSNRVLAVLREYSANAYDSHVAAGTTRPIEITLPNALSPTLVIKDYGTGLSVDEIIENFSKYGFSTKREDEAQVGFLGIGSKAALAYASQFTMISVKNNVRAVVVMSRDAEVGGNIQVVDVSATDDPNGVEIQVPCSNNWDMRNEAENFFSYWTPGTVLVNGKTPASVWDHKSQTIVLDPDVRVILDLKQNIYIVQGNVAYPAGDSPYYNKSIIVRVDLGSVAPTPSRESLQFTKRTKELVATILEFVDERIAVSIQKRIDAAPNATAAIVLAGQLIQQMKLPVHQFNYQGIRMVPYVTKSHLTWYVYDENASNESYIGTQALSGIVLVTDYYGKGVLKTTKERVKEWIEKNHPTVKRVLFVGKPTFGFPWTEGLASVSIKDLPKIAGTPKSIKKDLFRVANGNKMVWVPVTERAVLFRKEQYDLVVSLMQLQPLALVQFVRCTEIQETNYKIWLKDSVLLHDYVVEKLNDLVETSSPAQCALSFPYTTYDWTWTSYNMKNLDESNIVDKSFVATVQQFKNVAQISNCVRWNRIGKVIGVNFEEMLQKKAIDVKAFNKMYPLLEHAVNLPVVQFTEYLNATYQYNQTLQQVPVAAG